MSELTDIVYFNDHVVPVFLQDMLLRARDGETWTWTDTDTGALSLRTSQEAVNQPRGKRPATRGVILPGGTSRPPDTRQTHGSYIGCLLGIGPGLYG